MKIRQSPTKLKKNAVDNLDACFPSARYFQVHFEYLYETINELKQQVYEANQQIAILQQQLQIQSMGDIQNLHYADDTHAVGD